MKNLIKKLLRLEKEEIQHLDGRKDKLADDLYEYKYLRTGPENGWTMRADLYAKCPKCGYFMSMDPEEDDRCECGNLTKDMVWGRFGARTGDHTIEIYQKHLKTISRKQRNPMMYYEDCVEAYKNIEGWQMVTFFSVGGFEWLGFSKEQPNKMICISSQMSTIVNCDDGKVEECFVDYDEQEFIAICDELPNEQIEIAGQYGGKLPLTSGKGEKVTIQRTKDYIMTITFTSSQGKEIVIYKNYGAYICGFNYDGNYFVIADDSGIVILKRYLL